MKGIIYYVWQHRLLKRKELYTTDGKKVEIIDYGSWNEECNEVNNAKVRIDNELLSGNILLECNNKEMKYLHFCNEFYLTGRIYACIIKSSTRSNAS